MTLPNDTRAPHRQARWIEGENVGSATIPPFAAVEVVDNYRPESAGYTPGDGRTVLKIRLATQDNPCLTCIVGPCEIPYGEAGRIVTLDDPMLALVASASYAAGTVVGVREGSFVLEEGYCGYMIIGDYDAGTGGTMRVKRWDECGAENMVVRAIGCMLPGQGGKAQPQEWDSDTKCWKDAAGAPIDIIDPMGWLLAVPDDCFKVDKQRRCGSSSSGDYMPEFPFGMTQLVRVKELIECGDCGEVTVVRKSMETGETGTHCNTVETECKFQACNMTYRPISCDAEEYAIATIIPGQCCLPTSLECIAFLFPYPRPMFAKGQLAQNLCEGDGQITNGQILDACTKSDFKPPETAGNHTGMHACATSNVLMVWKVNVGGGDSCGWEIVSVADYELPAYMLDIACKDGGCKVEYKYKVQKRYGHYCECPLDEEKWLDTSLTFDEIEIPMGVSTESASGGISVLTDADCSTCSIVFKSQSLGNTSVSLTTKKVCVPCQKASMEDGEDIPLGEFAAIGAAGADVTITGVEQDFVTGLTVKSEVTGETGGDPVDCDTGVGLNLLITGTTKKGCFLCPSGGGGTLEAGVDVQLTAFKIKQVEPVTEAVFSCDPCPSLAVKTTPMYALCVGEESSADTVSCECIDCETEGSGSGSASVSASPTSTPSSTPSATGA